MILFQRFTHWEDGTFRGLDIEGWDRFICPKIHGLGVHALRPFPEWMTFEEFVDEHHHYASQFKESSCPPLYQLLSDMALMVETGVVKVKYE